MNIIPLLIANSMRKIRPNLKLLANGALALGAPMHPGCYNATSCQYTLEIIGPGFDCQTAPEVPANFSNCNLLYEGVDKSEIYMSDLYTIVNNSFQVSWRHETPREFAYSGNCTKAQSLDCSTTFGTYRISVSKSESSPTIFNTSFIRNDKLDWTKDLPILTTFYDYFNVDNALRSSPANISDLTMQFSRTQAVALRDAAIQPLVGHIFGGIFSTTINRVKHPKANGLSPTTDYESGAIGMPGLDILRDFGTLILGSKFVNMSEPLRPYINISSEGLQKYIEDVVISAIALNFTLSEPISILRGEETFIFGTPLQFYAPYAACLAATLAIYVLGIWDLHRNGVSAGNSFLQWTITTRVSKRLDDLARRCSPGGEENISGELENLELLFGASREMVDGLGKGVAGFGCVDEVEPYHNA